MKRFFLFIWLFAILLPLFPWNAIAQTQAGYLARADKGRIFLETYFPDFKEKDGIRFPTSTTFLSGEIPLGKTVRVIAELPFAYFKYESSNPTETDTKKENTLGNPLVGLRFRSRDSQWVGDFSVRIPVVKREKFASALVGAYSSIERWEAFLIRWTVLQLRGSYEHRFQSGFTVAGQLGYSLLVNSGNEDAEDTEGFLLYGFRVGLTQPTFRVAVEFLGRYLATKEGSFGDRSYHQLSFSTFFGGGKIWPGVMLKVPLGNDFRKMLNSVFGIQIILLL